MYHLNGITLSCFGELGTINFESKTNYKSTMKPTSNYKRNYIQVTTGNVLQTCYCMDRLWHDGLIRNKQVGASMCNFIFAGII